MKNNNQENPEQEDFQKDLEKEIKSFQQIQELEKERIHLLSRIEELHIYTLIKIFDFRSRVDADTATSIHYLSLLCPWLSQGNIKNQLRLRTKSHVSVARIQIKKTIKAKIFSNETLELKRIEALKEKLQRGFNLDEKETKWLKRPREIHYLKRWGYERAELSKHIPIWKYVLIQPPRNDPKARENRRRKAQKVHGKPKPLVSVFDLTATTNLTTDQR